MSKTGFVFRLFAAAVVVGAMGCGGGGSNEATPTEMVPIYGGITTVVKADTPSVPATTTDEGTPTSYVTTLNGVAKTVAIAASPTAVAAGTPIAVFPDDVPIINASFTRAPGDIEITCFRSNGISQVKTRFSNIVAARDGSLVLTRPLGLVPGQYFGSVEGPLYFGANGGKTLTVGSIGFMFEVLSDGACSFPTLITGALPANGGHTGSAGISVTTTSTPRFTGGAAGLNLSLANGSELVAGGSLDSNGKVTFRSLNGGFRVPTTGVDAVQFSVYGPVP
jgi:hypothetical protein